MAQKHNQNETQNAPMTRLGNLQLNAQQRIIRGTAFLSTSFSANNPILQLGELGYETDTNKLKIGDGVTAWNDLAYAGGGGDTSASLAQFDTMPTASADNLGNIVQYVGETDANYTNGYIYQCTGAGEPVVYSWTQIDVQPAPSGLPDQTGHSGEFLTTDGTDASWSNKKVVINNVDQSNTTSVNILGTNTGAWDSVSVGYSSSASSNATSIGGNTKASSYGVSIGYNVKTNLSNPNLCFGLGCDISIAANNAIQLGSSSYYQNTSKITVVATNSDANTMKVANANGNFEMMSADGTIPAARHATLPAADGTYVLKLVIASGVPTLSWVAE